MLKTEERLFGRVHKKFLSVVYMCFVRGGQAKGHFKFKRGFRFDLVVCVGCPTNEPNIALGMMAQ